MAHIICIVSQKGGTGKTTTAVNLAGCLAILEKRTLLIDCDPLGCATTGLGIDKDRLKGDLYDILDGDRPMADVMVATALDYLAVIPARFNLADIEQRLYGKPDREEILGRRLRQVADDFEYIILDAPPSLNFLAVSAMICAQWLLIPIQCQLFTLEGLGQLLDVAGHIQAARNPELKIAGVLFTMFDTVDRDTSSEAVVRNFSDNIMGTTIPLDRLLRKSSDFGKPLILYDVDSIGAKAYMDLTLEVVRFLNREAASCQSPNQRRMP
jgi:chromosome partitioning protein